jgi:hypothetical protein
VGRPAAKKTGPMTPAERQARRRARVGKSMNRQARKRYKQKQWGNAAQLRRERAAEPIPDGMDLRIGDFREVLADIADNSVPLILTDPPYGNEAEPLYRALAVLAARVLIPGGMLVCYTGSTRLNRDIKIFDEHLTYWHDAVMLHDQSQRLFGLGMIVKHKPILLYVKGFRRGRSLMPDVVYSKRDKSQHAWAQGDGGVRQWIEHLTEPGETIVDPFAGTATWARITVGMGRRWIGADIASGGTTAVLAESAD